MSATTTALPTRIRPVPAAVPLAGFILLVREQDTGRVLIEYSQNARMRLEDLARGGVQIDVKHISEWTQHASRIAGELRNHFRSRQVAIGAFWYSLDWSQAVTALEDYNLEGGDLRRDGLLTIGALVLVPSMKGIIGHVEAFQQDGMVRRARVHMVKPAQIGDVKCISALFPVSMLQLLPAPTMPEGTAA